MPFDGTTYPDQPKGPRRPARGDTPAVLIIVAVAFCLLVMPILAGATVVIARFTASP